MRWWKLSGALTLVAVAACGTQPNAETAENAPSTPATADATTSASAASVPATNALELAGETLEVMTFPSVASDLEVTLQGFSIRTGVDIEVVAVDLDVELDDVLAGGAQPDLVFFETSGPLPSAIERGAALRLNDPELGLDMELIESQFSETALGFAARNGERYGLPWGTTLKGQIWYRPDVLQQLGFVTPTTFDELVAVMNAAATAGQHPLALGNVAGWQVPDLFENVYLLLHGPNQYNSLFRRGTVEWTDPTVTEALEMLRRLLDPIEERTGETASEVNEQSFVDAYANMLQGGALFNHGPGYFAVIGAAVAPDQQPGVDYSSFAMPPIDPEAPDVAILGGLSAVPFSTSPATKELLEYVGSPEAAIDRAGSPVPGIVVSSNARPDEITNSLIRAEFEQLRTSADIVLDGSDMSSPAIKGVIEAAFKSWLVDSDDAALAATMEAARLEDQ